MQHTATHCDTLQHTATHCNPFLFMAPHYSIRQHTKYEQWPPHHFAPSATHCNTRHHAATHCYTLRHTLQHDQFEFAPPHHFALSVSRKSDLALYLCVAVCVLQRVAVCCTSGELMSSCVFVFSMLQRIALHRTVLQCVAGQCSVLQCGADWAKWWVCVYRVLQCVAVCRSRVAGWRNLLQGFAGWAKWWKGACAYTVCWSVLQCVAVMLQCIAVCCRLGEVVCISSVLQCVAVVLQCVAVCCSSATVHCSVLQCIVACCNVVQIEQSDAEVCVRIQCVTVCCSICTSQIWLDTADKFSKVNSHLIWHLAPIQLTFENFPALHCACHTGWRRLIACLKSQVIFRKRATNVRAFLRKTTCKDKASYDSTPPCISTHATQHINTHAAQHHTEFLKKSSKSQLAPKYTMYHANTADFLRNSNQQV